MRSRNFCTFTAQRSKSKGRQSTSTCEDQSFQLDVLQVLASTHSFWLLVLQVLASTKSFQLLVLQVLASTQSFQLLVIQVIASTQVISVFGTPGTPEYLRHFGCGYSRYSRVLSYFSCRYPRHSQVLNHFSVWYSGYSRVLSHLGSWYSRYSRVLSHFSVWYSRYSRVLSHFSFWYSRGWRVLKSFQLLVFQWLSHSKWLVLASHWLSPDDWYWDDILSFFFFFPTCTAVDSCFVPVHIICTYDMKKTKNQSKIAAKTQKQPVLRWLKSRPRECPRVYMNDAY